MQLSSPLCLIFTGIFNPKEFCKEGISSLLQKHYLMDEMLGEKIKFLKRNWFTLSMLIANVFMQLLKAAYRNCQNVTQ